MPNLFENQSINMENLPKLPLEDFLPIEKKYKVYLLLRNAILFGILALAVLVFQLISTIEINKWILIIAYLSVSSFWLLSFIIVQLGFPRKAYLLRKHDLVYKTGYLMQKITAVPKNRIQHIEIRQGIMLRIFKLSKIVVFTAGGSGSDLSITGLKPEVAEQLKEDISLNIFSHE